MAPMTNNRNKFTLILAALLAIIAGALSWHELSKHKKPVASAKPATHKATVLPQFKKLQPFSLTDHTGNAFDNQTLTGQWTFLNFGYTYCPDVCPTTLAMLAAMDEKLQSMKTVQPYQIAFVSIDPERDSQQQLADYVTHFRPTMLGATGPDAELKRLTQPLGILYARVTTDKNSQNYLMDHSAAIILVDPQGRYHALFSPPHDARYLVDDFMTITNNY